MKQKKRTWYLVGNPVIREKIAFWWRCTIYAFALIGVGSVARFVYEVLK